MERAERVLQSLATRTPEARAAAARDRKRLGRSVKRHAIRSAVAVAVLTLLVALFGVFVQPIGLLGLVGAVIAAIVIMAVLAFTDKDPVAAPFSEHLTNAEVVNQLDAKLHRSRPALPPPAQTSLDAISAKLPLLEARLQTLDALDPLAQDARRLMGQHLPDLLSRYEKVPAEYRKQQDGGGITVEDRLLSGLGAARSAIDDLGQKLAQGDVNAFETQGRFIESRYKEGDLSEG